MPPVSGLASSEGPSGCSSRAGNVRQATTSAASARSLAATPGPVRLQHPERMGHGVRRVAGYLLRALAAVGAGSRPYLLSSVRLIGSHP